MDDFPDPDTQTRSGLTPEEHATINELLAWNRNYEYNVFYWFIRLHFCVDRRAIVGKCLDTMEKKKKNRSHLGTDDNKETRDTNDELQTDVTNHIEITRLIGILQKQLETTNQTTPVRRNP
jgi:hypothetical protein